MVCKWPPRVTEGGNARGGRLAQLVRAPSSHGGGRWFDPSSAHHVNERGWLCRPAPFLFGARSVGRGDAMRSLRQTEDAHERMQCGCGRGSAGGRNIVGVRDPQPRCCAAGRRAAVAGAAGPGGPAARACSKACGDAGGAADERTGGPGDPVLDRGPRRHGRGVGEPGAGSPGRAGLDDEDDAGAGGDGGSEGGAAHHGRSGADVPVGQQDGRLAGLSEGRGELLGGGDVGGPAHRVGQRCGRGVGRTPHGERGSDGPADERSGERAEAHPDQVRIGPRPAPVAGAGGGRDHPEGHGAGRAGVAQVSGDPPLDGTARGSLSRRELHPAEQQQADRTNSPARTESRPATSPRPDTTWRSPPSEGTCGWSPW